MSQKKFAVVIEVAALAKMIGSIGKRKVSLDADVQVAATQCVAQSIVHRNATPAMQLMDVVSKFERPALTAFFEKFGNLAYSKEKQNVVFFDVEKHVEGAKALVWDEPYAQVVTETIWLNMVKAPTPKSVYDAQEEASKFIDRMVKLSTKGGVEVKNRGLVTALKGAYDKYVAETFLANTKADENALPKELQKAPEAGAGNAPASPEKLAELATQFGGKPEPVAKAA